MTCELLQKVLQAHGGLERWNSFEKVQATIVTGGQLFGMKGTPQDSTPRRMTVATRRQWASLTPYGADDHRTDFTANRVAIEKMDGIVVKERLRPAEHAEGKAVDAPWDALDRAYFKLDPHLGLGVSKAGKLTGQSNGSSLEPQVATAVCWFSESDILRNLKSRLIRGTRQ